MKPAISIIIPVYHAEKFLPRCLDSVIQSRLKNIEILVVDDASTKRCKDIVNQYKKKDNRIRLIQHNENKGLFHARYTGILNANGRYIAHLDPDDWIKNDIYNKAYEKAIKEDSDVILFNIEQCDDKDYCWTEEYNQVPKFDNYTGMEILERVFQTQTTSWIWHVSWNKIVKTTIAKEVLTYFTKYKHINMYEDLLWSIALYLHINNKPSISSITDIGLVYYRHPESITKKTDYINYIKKTNDILNVLNDIKHLLKLHKKYKSCKNKFKAIQNRILKMYCPEYPKENKFIIPYIKIKLYYLLKWNLCTKKSTQTLNQESAAIIITKKIPNSVSNISIYGTSELAILLEKKISDKGIKINYFISTYSKNSSYINGTKIISPQQAIAFGEKNFAIASVGSLQQITYILHNISNNNKINLFTI